MTGAAEVVERRPLRRGDRVTVAAVVRNRYVDADAARRKGDDGERVVLELPSGALWHAVRVADVVPVEQLRAALRGEGAVVARDGT